MIRKNVIPRIEVLFRLLSKNMKIFRFKVQFALLLICFPFLCGCENNDKEIYGDEFITKVGVDLFDEAARHVVLTPESASAEIEYSAGYRVTLWWVTSNTLNKYNHLPEMVSDMDPLLTITGDCYFPNYNTESFMAGEIVSENFAYKKHRHSYMYFQIKDWEGTGVEIINTHQNRFSRLDDCEFVYRGWLQVTLGGTDEDHRFIKLKSIAEAPEGYETARLYFNPAYDFVNNMITVTQEGYSVSEGGH